MIDKIKRLKEALSAEKDPNAIKSMRAIISGMTNFYFRNKEADKKAIERFEKYCKDCAYNIYDPIKEMRVKDFSIEGASQRMCSFCGGCVLSYKLRQCVKPCEFWKE